MSKIITDIIIQIVGTVLGTAIISWLAISQAPNSNWRAKNEKILYLAKYLIIFGVSALLVWYPDLSKLSLSFILLWVLVSVVFIAKDVYFYWMLRALRPPKKDLHREFKTLINRLASTAPNTPEALQLKNRIMEIEELIYGNNFSDSSSD